MVHAACYSCPLRLKTESKNPALSPIGSDSPTLYVLGIAPDKLDDKKGKIFSSTKSSVIRNILRDFEADTANIRFNNALGCIPNKGKIDAEELKCCTERVLADIKATKPRAILALGEEAVRVLWPNGFPGIYTITRTRGGLVPLELDGEFYAVVPTYSTAYVGYKEDLQDVWATDIELALSYAEGDIDELPWGLLREPPNKILIKTVAQLEALFRGLKTASIVAFDFETTSLKPWKLRDAEVEPAIFSIAFAFDDYVYALPVFNFWSSKVFAQIMQALGKWFTESLTDQIKIAHNIKFDLLWGLIQAGEAYTGLKTGEIEPAGVYHCTQLLCWLLDERPGAAKLKVAAWRYLGKPDWSIEITDIFKYTRNEVLEYNALDAWYTLQLWHVVYPKVKAHKEFFELYHNIMLPAAFSYIQVEARGCLIDEDKRLSMAKKLDIEKEELLAKIQVETGGILVNPDSPIQLSRYFVDECHYELLKKNKKGWSVNAETLDYIVEEYDDTVAKLILEMRGVNKLNSTYVTGLEDKIFIGNRIHASFNLALTVTGRTSCSDPNLQNFPKRKHKEIRQLLVAPPGYKIVSLDLAQIEARLFGVITGDPVFIDALWAEYDIHLENSIILFGKEQAAEFRGVVKNGTFALLYGAGNEKVAKTTGASVEAIAELRRLIFTRFKTFKPWQKMIASFEKRNGYVESLFGKRRRSPISYTEMLNHTTQSTASDMCISAMPHINKRYPVLMTVHDDITSIVPEDSVEDAIIYMAQAMIAIPWMHIRNSRWLKKYVPLGVEAAIGDNWWEMEEVLKVSAVSLGLDSMGKAIKLGTQLINDKSYHTK